MLRLEYTMYSKSSRYKMAGFMMLITLLGVCVFSAKAQFSPQGAIEIEPGGQLWIEGKASIVNYTCEAERLSGNGNIKNTENPQENVKGHGAVSVSVEVPVHSLECGKRGMNKDMYEALKAEQFKNITYQLLTANLADSLSTISDEEGEWMNIKTIGILEIAGVKDTTEVYVKGRILEEEQFRVKGKKEISMKEFNINPPTALLGLIKANERLTVHFDVTVRLKNS